MKVALLACCGLKLDHAAPAQDLYISPLFRKARRYAEMHTDTWLILSAKHGLVWRQREIEPYDLSLADLSVAERIEWACRVRHQLQQYRNDELIVLAGRRYWKDWAGAFPTVILPLRGLGIGQQLQFLTRHTEIGAQP